MRSDVPVEDGSSRRDFIYVCAGSATALGLAAVAWPFVRQFGPAADTLALSSADVDIGPIPEGGEIRLLIGGKPFFVRHRTAAEIAAARSVNVEALRDPQTDDQRLRPDMNGNLDPRYLIVSGVCTHLGCVPVGPSQGSVGDYGGWYCPCHGSHYDTSGRIRSGPAPSNLAVPSYRYLTDTVVKISL